MITMTEQLTCLFILKKNKLFFFLQIAWSDYEQQKLHCDI